MNINYLDKRNPARKLMKNLENSTGLKQVIETPTRITNTTSTLIDLMYTNAQHIMDKGIIHLNISDHEAIFLSRKKQKEKFEIKTIDASSYVNYNKLHFQQTLSNLDWNALYTLDDVDQAWDLIETNIKNTISISCPIRKIRIKEKDEPWITNELLEMIHDKINFRKIALASKQPADHERAKLPRNQTKAAIKTAKADFIKENLERDDNDPKKFWDRINQLVCNDKGQNIINLIDQTNGENIDKNNTCTFINEFFSNIGPNLAPSQLFSTLHNSLVLQ